ncbi:MAG: hypothetical protein ACQETO_03625 [Pseudomonadota bacterium]
MSERKRWQPALPELMARYRRGAAPVRADYRLLLTEQGLCDVASGRWQSGVDADEPETVARAAATLLRNDREAARTRGWRERLLPEQRPAVELLLPPGCCVATTVTLPGVAPEAVPAALRLQADSLLPGHEGPLALAVRPGRDPDALSEVALWMPQSRLEEWYRAFDRAGLLLVAVQPRNIAAVAGLDEAWLLDGDHDHQTLLHWKQGALRAWHQVHRRDLEQDDFRQQWQSLLEQADGGQYLTLETGPAWRDRLRTGDAGDDYRFRPQGALDHARRNHRQRLQLGAGAAAIAALLVAALPFLWQTVQMARLESRLADVRAESADAREDQAAVRAFETHWEVLTGFPRQAVDEVLLDLQEVLLPSVLGSLQLDEGHMNIEGQSSDPQRLLQDLEAHDRFTGVDFAAATSNNRYSIDLRLTTVDFAAYYDWYFPERR